MMDLDSKESNHGQISNSLLVTVQRQAMLMGQSAHVHIEERLRKLADRYAVIYGRIYDIAQARFVGLSEVKLECANEQYGFKPNMKEDFTGETWKMLSLWDAYTKYHARPVYSGIVFNPGVMGSKLDHSGAFNLAHRAFLNLHDGEVGALKAYEGFLEQYFKGNPDLIAVWHAYIGELLFKPMTKSLEWHIHCEDAMIAQMLPNILREVANPYTADVHPLMPLLARQEACFGKLLVIDMRIPGSRRLVGDVFYNWAQQGVCAFSPKNGVPLILNNFLRVFGVHADDKGLPDVSRLRCVYSVGKVSNKLAVAKAALDQWMTTCGNPGEQLYAYYLAKKGTGSKSATNLWFESLNN